jgi:branched-chain amino acid aminotransferase
MIGTGKQLGVKVPTEALLFIIATPYKDYAAGEGLKLLASKQDTNRAWPGGFGYAKLGANYGPALETHGTAQSLGFDQVLWLFGKNRQVTEAGASNIFVVWRNKETEHLELITPSLASGLILDGITRRSVLEVARSKFTQQLGELAPVDVVEQDFTIDDVQRSWTDGRIVEAFVTGTAVSHFHIGFDCQC